MTTLAADLLIANKETLGRSLHKGNHPSNTDTLRDYLDAVALASGFLDLAWNKVMEELDKGIGGRELSALLVEHRDLFSGFAGLCAEIRDAALKAPEFEGKSGRLAKVTATLDRAREIEQAAVVLLERLSSPPPAIDESRLPTPSGGPGEAPGYRPLDDLLARLSAGDDL